MYFEDSSRQAKSEEPIREDKNSKDDITGYLITMKFARESVNGSFKKFRSRFLDMHWLIEAKCFVNLPSYDK